MPCLLFRSTDKLIGNCVFQGGGGGHSGAPVPKLGILFNPHLRDYAWLNLPKSEQCIATAFGLGELIKIGTCNGISIDTQ